MTELKTSGDRVTWLNAVAARVMDGGARPPSVSQLYDIVPLGITTAQNDGHVTAALALGEEHRKDFRAGQRIIIDEMVGVLREQGFIEGDKTGLRWIKPVDGEWSVMLGYNKVTVRGQRERRLARERHILGETKDGEQVGARGLVEMRVSAGFDVEIIGERGASRRETLMIHPYAFLVPPMTEAEREAFREDIATHGVKVPLVLYPDVKDTNPRTGKPKLKVLDGRNRLYFGAQLNKPVRVEVFEGTDEQARSLIISLNFKRRHLTVSQQTLMAIRVFGDEAKEESRVAYKEHVGRPSNAEKSVVDSPSISDTTKEHETGNTMERIAKKAQKAGLTSVTEHGVRNMMSVLDAPETLAKVEAGGLGKVADANQAAAKEKGTPVKPRGQRGSKFQSIHERLGRAGAEYATILADLDVPLGGKGHNDVFIRIDEHIATLGEIRDKLRERYKLDK